MEDTFFLPHFYEILCFELILDINIQTMNNLNCIKLILNRKKLMFFLQNRFNYSCDVANGKIKYSRFIKIIFLYFVHINMVYIYTIFKLKQRIH